MDSNYFWGILTGLAVYWGFQKLEHHGGARANPLPYPTRDIPDLRSARKIASYLSRCYNGVVEVVRQDQDHYRIVYRSEPSPESAFLGAYKNEMRVYP